MIIVLISFASAQELNYWDMNDEVLDQWGSNDGTNNGDLPDYRTDVPTYAVSGNGTKSQHLDGTGDYISLANNPLENLGTGSISLWLKIPNVGSGNLEIGNGYVDSSNYWYFYITGLNNDEKIYFQTKDGGTSDYIFYSNIGQGADYISDNTWKHLVITWDGTDEYAYLDNESQTNGDPDNNYGFTYSGNGDWGTDDVGYLEGYLDEIMIFDHVLTPTEVEAIYKYGNPNGTGESDTYFKVTAKDEYAHNSLTNFSAKVNGTTYYTTNGTIKTNISTTSTDQVTIIMGSNENGGYFNKTYTNQAVTENKEYSIFQAEVNFQAFRKILNTSITGNYTTNGTIINTTKQHIKAGTYEIRFNSSGWFNKSQNITIPALYNGTKNITGIYNTILNITVNNAYTSNPLENFTGWVYDKVLGYNETYTVNTYEGFIKLIKNRNYTIYATNPSYAIDSNLNYKNETWNNTYYNITFLLYTNNSLRIKIYDENTGSLITGTNITIVLTGNESETTYYTTNGNKFIENLQDGNYSVKFSGGNYTLKTYTITVAERSTQSLNAYLSTSTNNVIFTIRDSNSYTVMEEVSITMYRLINASWVVVEAKNTDITGRAQFTYFIGIQYKFFVSSVGYDDKIFYLDPIIFSSYNINLNKEVTLSEDQNYLGVNVQYYPNNFYANQTNNFTWLIQSPSGTLESYHFNISYPGGNGYYSGSNTIGEDFTHSFNLSTTTITDKVNLTYCYKSSIGTAERCYTFTYTIIGIYGESSFTAVKSNTYGLSLLTRILLATLIVLVVSGILSLMGNSLIGIITGLLLLGLFARIEFIPLWSILLSLFLGVVFIIWRSE